MNREPHDKHLLEAESKRIKLFAFGLSALLGAWSAVATLFWNSPALGALLLLLAVFPPFTFGVISALLHKRPHKN